MVWSLQQGQNIQKVDEINLPPGTLERAAQTLGINFAKEPAVL